MTDPGHIGPAIPYFAYSTCCLVEGLRLAKPLRIRFVEPVFMIVVGTLVAILHWIVIQKCDDLHWAIDTTSNWTRERCNSVNLAHIWLGWYAAVVGVVCFVYHVRYWQQRIGYLAPAQRKQYEFLIPSVFAVLGIVMASHEQDEMYEQKMHEYTSILALLFMLLRSISYQVRGFLVPTAIVGVFASFIFTFASSAGMDYYQSRDNFFGTPMPTHNVALFLATVTMMYVLGWLAAVPLFYRLRERFCSTNTCFHPELATEPSSNRLLAWIRERLDDKLTDPIADDQFKRDSIRPLIESRDGIDFNESADEEIDI